MLRNLATVAQRLSNDELRVLLAIGNRAWVGQSKYGCLQLARDQRDFRHEAFEEVCDGCFYIAVSLLTGPRPRLGTSRRAFRG